MKVNFSYKGMRRWIKINRLRIHIFEAKKLRKMLQLSWNCQTPENL